MLINSSNSLDARNNEIEVLLKMGKTDIVSVNESTLIKSSIVMMIYNLIEGVFSILIQEVFDYLIDGKKDVEQISNNLTETLAKYNLKKIKNEKELLAFRNEKPINVPEMTDFFKFINLFSGDLDAKKIREISDKFGVTIRESKKSKSLLYVKNLRNKLAHGEIRYSEACRNQTITEIEEIKNNVVSFLRDVINQFENIYC